MIERSLADYSELMSQGYGDDDISALITRALTDERGLAGKMSLDDDARQHLLRMAGGDARRALTYLEAGAGGAQAAGSDVTSIKRI